MPETLRQMIALGGGGFSMEPDKLTLDQYVLAQSAAHAQAVAQRP